jgi:hypothetical protein
LFCLSFSSRLAFSGRVSLTSSSYDSSTHSESSFASSIADRFYYSVFTKLVFKVLSLGY